MADVKLLNHLTAREIDLLLAAAADPARATHATTCEACAVRVAAARAERAQFLDANPPAVRAAQLLDAHARRPQPAPPPGAPSWSWLRWLVPATSLAAVVVALAVLRPDPTPLPDGPEILSKGSASVGLLIKRAGASQVTPARSGETVGAGDAVQLLVTIDEPTRVRVLQLEDSGTFTLLLDEQAARSGALSRSFVMDDSGADVRLLVVGNGWAHNVMLKKRVPVR